MERENFTLVSNDILFSDWQQLLRAGAAPGPRRSVPVAAKRAADPRGGRAALPQPGPEQDGRADGSPPARAAAAVNSGFNTSITIRYGYVRMIFSCFR